MGLHTVCALALEHTGTPPILIQPSFTSCQVSILLLVVLWRGRGAYLAAVSPLVIVSTRGVNRGGGGGVRQDVDEVRVHHVVIKQVKDAHPI
jgi:hypothetical protein